MILVNISIWIDHLRRSNEWLLRMLEQGHVPIHPFVIGEVALGNLRNRDAIVNALQDLPQAAIATDAEVLRFVHQNTLYAVGSPDPGSHPGTLTPADRGIASSVSLAARNRPSTAVPPRSPL